MLNVFQSYLSGFKEISNYKLNDRITNDLAILKIISYFTFLISLAFAINSAVSLYGRFRKGPASKDETIADKANQILGKDANNQAPAPSKPADQPYSSKAPAASIQVEVASKQESQTSSTNIPAASANVIQAAVSPTSINSTTTSSSFKPVALRIEVESLQDVNNLIPASIQSSLKEQIKLFSHLEIVTRDTPVSDKEAIIIKTTIADNRPQQVWAWKTEPPHIIFSQERDHDAFAFGEGWIYVPLHYNSQTKRHVIDKQYADELVSAIQKHLQ